MSQSDSEAITTEEAVTFRFNLQMAWWGFWSWMALVGFVTSCRWVWEQL